jgi:hypothetical protein
MTIVKLSCNCKKVQGQTEYVSAKSGNRIVCCCIDCQKFATFLCQEQQVLDQYGGTDIFQMPISHVHVTQGNEHIACIKLSDKGLHRWYTKCCHTPIGNTLGGKGPFIGVIHSFMQHSGTRDSDLGVHKGYVHSQSARLAVPDNLKTSSFKAISSLLIKLISWKLKGLHRPSVFFNEDGKPVVKPEVLKQGSEHA